MRKGTDRPRTSARHVPLSGSCPLLLSLGHVVGSRISKK